MIAPERYRRGKREPAPFQAALGTAGDRAEQTENKSIGGAVMLRYTLEELIKIMEPQARRDKALIDKCIDGLGLYAAIKAMQEVGKPYPDCGYGGMFRQWMYSDAPKPYNSYGNGAAMRVSACGFAVKIIDGEKLLSRRLTEVICDHL
ncbi:MAG: hypothetical protein LBU32_08870 [Clostridiales bacterium]|nr:hypothetical protein [Clostridiales bacterium]